MSYLELTGVTVSQDGRRLLDDLDLSIGAGERMAVLGPSGSGKTTLLRAISGLQPLDRGTIVVDGQDVSHLHPRDRNVALIDQQATLQPHLDVERNLGFALRLRRTPSDQVEERVAAQTRAFSLGSLLPRRPRTLSHGERHEVALARSLIRRVSVLLMDEPLARIDPTRRSRLLRELIQMQEGYGVTLVVATNDQRTAMALAHQVAVLDEGAIAQVGTPGELYARPANLFVAEFLGSPSMNLLDGVLTRTEGRVEVHADPFVLPTWNADLTRRVGEPVVLGIRPQQLVVDDSRHRASEQVRVVRREFLGAEVTLHLRAPSGRRLTALVPAPGPDQDSHVVVSADPGEVHLFDPVTGKVIAQGV
jgi:ABC-type sugar transport system ATPase subunit